jgi:hypothetical protein
MKDKYSLTRKLDEYINTGKAPEKIPVTPEQYRELQKQFGANANIWAKSRTPGTVSYRGHELYPYEV